MKRFIVLYHAPVDVMSATTNRTPEEQAKGMEAWMQWAQKCGDKLVDLGAPLMNGVEFSSNGRSTPSTKSVTGFSILQASSFDEAKSLLKGHPHLAWSPESTIELHETMPIPGME